VRVTRPSPSYSLRVVMRPTLTDRIGSFEALW
jgi:hypothetical protein